MSAELSGRVALVTGAAQGIGEAVARALGAAGAELVLVDLHEPGELIESLRGAGIAARAQQLDVADEAQVDALFGSIAARERRLDAVVNSAGILRCGAAVDMPMADFDRQIAVNLRGSFMIARGAARLMREGGRIILVSSELAYLGRETFAGYCASKAGVVGLTRALARELAPAICVNNIAPGPVDTPMLGAENLSAQWLAKEADNPLGRIGKPQEIAALARFLCGPDAGFFTGQSLSPNGGAVML